MKTIVALVVSVGAALAIAARMSKSPTLPPQPTGSWEPADAATP